MLYKWSLLMKKEYLIFIRNTVLVLLVLYLSTLDIYQNSSNTTDPKYYPLGVYDLDQGFHSQEIMRKLRSPYFYVKTFINQENEINRLMDQDVVSAIVTFPRDFTKDIKSNKTADMQVVLDGTSSNASEIALNYIYNIVAEYNASLWLARLKASGDGRVMPLVEVRPLFYANTSLNEGWILVLQELYLVITLLGLLFTATAIVNEKQFGTIEQLMVSPLKTFEVILPKVASMISIIMAVVLIALFFVLRPLGVPLEGSVWDLLLVTFIYIFTLTGYSLVVATLSNNLSETILISMLLIIPIMLLSGMYVPIESLPPVIQGFIAFSPLKYYLNLANGVFLKGNSLLLMWKDLSILLFLGISSFAFGLWRFRKAFSE